MTHWAIVGVIILVLILLEDRFTLIRKIVYFTMPVIAVMVAVGSASEGDSWTAMFMGFFAGVFLVTRIDDFMDWRYRGISPFNGRNKFKGGSNG